jgi:hypothetical protein
MDRVFEFLILLVIGGFMLAKFGLFDDALDLVRASSEPESDASYMTSASPWSKNYDPDEAARRNVYYENCAAARAAGAAPIYAGQPGYASHLDRDGDGVACEPYRGRR